MKASEAVSAQIIENTGFDFSGKARPKIQLKIGYSNDLESYFYFRTFFALKNQNPRSSTIHTTVV